MASEEKRVLITGGSGFIGLHVVNEALKSGYKVNTTTRSSESEAALPLKGLQKKYPKQLEIFEADLLQPDAYKEAIKGVDAVLHVATPVLMGQSNDNPDAQIKPAVEGTQNVLQTCLKSDTVKTIIVTSSCLTMIDFSKDSKYIFTEKDFSPHVGPDSDAYIRSKILAEQVTWDFNKHYQDRFRIATVHPTLVFGPDLEVEGVEIKNPRSNSGKKALLNIIQGIDKDIEKGVLHTVDVRDVAIAHIKALENSQATGRFAIFGRAISKVEVVQQLNKILPRDTLFSSELLSLPIPEYIEHRFDTTKSQQILGLTYRPFETSLNDSVRQLKAQNQLS